MTTMTTKANPYALTALADQINDAHQQCEAAVHEGIGHALEAGRLLLEAKRQVAHGNWLPWLEAHCRLSARTAQGYMRLARHCENGNTQRVAHLPLRDALALMATPRKSSTIPLVENWAHLRPEPGSGIWIFQIDKPCDTALQAWIVSHVDPTYVFRTWIEADVVGNWSLVGDTRGVRADRGLPFFAKNVLSSWGRYEVASFDETDAIFWPAPWEWNQILFLGERKGSR